jgi:hypothetical protein
VKKYNGGGGKSSLWNPKNLRLLFGIIDSSVILLTLTLAVHYSFLQREGRIQSAERAVPTLVLHNLANLLSA